MFYRFCGKPKIIEGPRKVQALKTRNGRTGRTDGTDGTDGTGRDGRDGRDGTGREFTDCNH